MSAVRLTEQETRDIVSVLRAAAEKPNTLSAEERKEYQAASKSVVDSRRYAEIHDGDLQVC